MRQKNLVVFDLDGSTLDSSHRQLTLPDGSLCLAHWRENSTREAILADRPLPLCALWRALAASDSVILAVCTARVIQQHDYDLLEMHKLPYHHFLCRDGDHDTRRDAELKRDKLQPLIKQLQPRRVFLFDDNASVLEMAESLGIVAINAVSYNRINKENRA